MCVYVRVCVCVCVYVCVCVHACASVLGLCVRVFVWWNGNKWDHYLGRGQRESGRRETVIILPSDDAETMLICLTQQCRLGY